MFPIKGSHIVNECQPRRAVPPPYPHDSALNFLGSEAKVADVHCPLFYLKNV